MQFHLSHEQTSAIDQICDIFLHSPEPDHKVAVLTGPAGTGKTTVVAELIRQIKMQSPLSCVSLGATTHRAAKVLRDVTGEMVETVHFMFKISPSVTKYGKEILNSSGICSIPHGTIVIIDESSMLGNQLLQAISPIIKSKYLKILFVGDPFQLPPPVDTCSIFDGTIPTYSLTEIHRQKEGNPILDKADEFREFIEGTRRELPNINTAINSRGEGIHVLSHGEFVTQFVRKYSDYSAGAEVDIPLCTFTNESAVNYNNIIRKSAYFLEDTILPFYPNERLISNAIVMEHGKPTLANNEVIHVKEYTEATYHSIPGYQVTVDGDYNRFTRSHTKKVFVPISQSAADIVLNKYKKIAVKNKSKLDWVAYYAIKNGLADLRPPFAGTTHKAQGGTFPAVFIDITNINKCKSLTTRARLIYVALTRATHNVYINS